MASRTKQKEEARARRLAEEQARAERQRRERRLRMIGGSVLAAVAVVAAAIAISSGGGSGASGLQTGTQATKTVASVQQLLSGIPQSGARLGSPSAPVTMVYYGDLQCPICRDFTVSGGFPQLVANDVRNGKVQVVYRSFQTATQDRTTFLNQQAAALAAGQQHRFWNYTELFYHQQGAEGTGYVTDSYLGGLAKQVPGLNFSQWSSARNGSALTAQVQADGTTGSAQGVNATPTLIMQGPKGKVQVPGGVPDYSTLEQAVKSVA